MNKTTLETAEQADLNYIKDYNTKYNPTSTELAEEASSVRKLYYKIQNMRILKLKHIIKCLKSILFKLIILVPT